MGNCKTCKFWQLEEEPYSEIINAKKCAYAIHTEETTKWGGEDNLDRVLKDEFKETKAFVVDGSGYYAAFYTKEDFGCNQYQQSSKGTGKIKRIEVQGGK